MLSSREKLIKELKETGDYLEVTAEERDKLIEQMQYVKSLLSQRVTADAKLVKEIESIKELVSLTKGDDWKASLMSTIDDVLSYLGK